MREVELKAVVDDLPMRRKMIEDAGAALSYEGKISDTRYDFASSDLSQRDEVLRARRYYDAGGSVRTFLDWKGPTETRDVYKIREEITTPVEDFDSLGQIFDKLGLVVTWEIDREIAQYQLGSATIRFETYPRMDVLVEVEGDPAAIEAAIEAVGLPRGTFNSASLPDFVVKFEQRTGVRAAMSGRELEGDYGFREAGE